MNELEQKMANAEEKRALVETLSYEIQVGLLMNSPEALAEKGRRDFILNQDGRIKKGRSPSEKQLEITQAMVVEQIDVKVIKELLEGVTAEPAISPGPEDPLKLKRKIAKLLENLADYNSEQSEKIWALVNQLKT